MSAGRSAAQASALSSCSCSALRGSRLHVAAAARPQRCCRRQLAVRAAKNGIHPQVFEEAKVFCNGEEVLTVSGTKEKYVVDVWSGNHPFYLGGTEMLLSDEGRVNKFNSRYGGLGAYGKPGPVTPGGDKKLEYKKPQPGKKGQKGGKKK